MQTRYCSTTTHFPILFYFLVATARVVIATVPQHFTFSNHNLQRNVAVDNTMLSMEALKLEQFKRRKETLERKTLQSQWRRPPNPFLGPLDVVTCILEELRDSSSRYSGVTTLLETSTDAWRDILRQSVAAPKEATNTEIAPSLETALGRPNNQFAILLGVEDKNFQITFPTDPLDYGDTCWVECRLRSAINDELLVAMGWSLEKRQSDGAWLVSTLDWQDFREAYRPGIGREEWERICG